MSGVGKKALKIKGIEYVQGTDPGEIEEGKCYVIEFWATWCPPCRTSIPHINSLQEQHKDVIFVGISNEGKSQVLPFVQKMGKSMTYRTACDPKGITRPWSEEFGIQGIPTAFVVDKKGVIRYQGHPMQPDFEAAIEKYAKEQVEEKIELPKEQEELMKCKVKLLKGFMRQNHISAAGMIEKEDLVAAILKSGKI